jgi:hypothetical protein
MPGFTNHKFTKRLPSVSTSGPARPGSKIKTARRSRAAKTLIRVNYYMVFDSKDLDDDFLGLDYWLVSLGSDRFASSDLDIWFCRTWINRCFSKVWTVLLRILEDSSRMFDRYRFSYKDVKNSPP